MLIKIVENMPNLPPRAFNQCYLVRDAWDDWFKFATRFSAFWYDNNGKRSFIGYVKIGKVGLESATYEAYATMRQRGEDVSGYRCPRFDCEECDQLPDEYFSLGCQDSYYEFLGKDEEKQSVLKALNDIAYAPKIYQRHRNEEVMLESLMRGIPSSRIRDRFSKLAHNKPALTDYEFEYSYPKITGADGVSINFKVSTEPIPPSNIKVVIGRNGVGKTHLLRNIAYAICRYGQGRRPLNVPENDWRSLSPPNDCGKVNFEKGEIYGVIYASFSPFETDEWVPQSGAVAFHKIGYKQNSVKSVASQHEASALNGVCARETERVIDEDSMAVEFAKELTFCRSEPWKSRWLQCVEILKQDLMFGQLDGERLLDLTPGEIRTQAIPFFKKLSSGHSALMLIVTQLVRKLDDKFLLLIDEPESHLHPPLLGLFVNCLSWLLRERNAVSIIATHSPVILQEVQRESVWILNRSGRQVQVANPVRETFGENIAILMQEVFGLELDKLGYHTMLSRLAREQKLTYEEIVAKFKGSLGLEAQGILRVMLAHTGAQQL